MKKVLSIILSAIMVSVLSISAFAAEENPAKSEELTEIVCILDQSGSMYSLKSDTIGSYNSFLEGQKECKGKAIITTVLFNHEYQLLYKGVDIENAKLTQDQYKPSGCTALLDAVGKTITDVKNRQSSAAKELKPSKTIFVIITDGYENASKEYKKNTIKSLIEDQEKNNGWSFLFFGANIDSVSAGADIGIRRDRAVNFSASAKGLKEMSEIACNRVASIRG